MPRAIVGDTSRTKSYIPKVSEIPGFSPVLAQFYKQIENRCIHEGCALLRKKFKEDLFTYCIENGILQDSFEPSNDNTNVFNAPQELFVVKQDPDSFEPSNDNTNVVNAPQELFVVKQDPGAHYGYNCPLKVLVVSNPEPCLNQNIDELPQTLPSFDPKCYSEDGNSFTYDSTSNLVHKSPNVFDPPLQPPTYSYEFCGNDSYYGHDFTPSLSTEEPDNSLSMGDEHLNTILATESNEFIKSSVENLVPIPSESEGIPDKMCDVPFHDNSSPLDVSKDQFKDFSNSNDDSTSNDDDSFSIDNIKYIEASPPDSELVSSESSSTSLNSLLEETNTFDNSLPELETFCFDLEEISSGSTTTHYDISLPEYESFYDDHFKEICSGSTTTHYDISLPEYESFYDDHFKEICSGSTTTYSDSSLYDSFIFDLSINPFPPADRSDFYELTISPPVYDCFCFKNEPNLGDFAMDVVEDTFPTREPRVHENNVLSTHPTLQLNLEFILFSESLFAYVVWIFLPFLSYSVAPQYLLSFRNEDTIFDPGICSYRISSFMSDVSHRSGTFIKFKVLNESPMEILFFT
nr:hypothetical protein [Tanacetum cinerariifolium]